MRQLLFRTISVSSLGFCSSKPCISRQKFLHHSLGKMYRGGNRGGYRRGRGFSAFDPHRQKPVCNYKVNDDVQDSIHDVADNQQDGAPLAACSVSNDRYTHFGRAQHGKTSPERAVGRISKHLESITVVGCPQRQDKPILPVFSGGKGRPLRTERPQHDGTSPYSAVDSSSKHSKNLPSNDQEWPALHARSGSLARSSQRPQHSQTLAEKTVGLSSKHQAYSPLLGPSDERPFLAGKHEQTFPEKTVNHSSSELSECSSKAVFDICPFKSRSTVTLKAPLHVKNREKRKGLKCEKVVLRPGMVLLKKYISHGDQVKIIKKCRDLGLGLGGFYQPGYQDGGKLHLQMMCLGKNWDPEVRSYVNHRSIDGALAPSIPGEFKQLVEEALEVSHAFIKQELKNTNVESILPGMHPDICIVNFYTHSGKLGLHQDRDESPESLENKLPVVSFSIGDSADFLYGDDRDVDKAKKVLLESGDVLIFGGDSRHIFHGVPSIVPKSAPSLLVEEANLRPGRLNLTFRKY